MLNKKLNKKLLLLALSGTVLGLAAPTAMASNRAGAWTFGLGAGPYFYSPERHLQSRAIVNASMAYNFSQQWAAEFLIGGIHTRSTKTYTYTRNSKSVTNKPAVTGGLYLLDGIYRFNPGHTLQPFLLAGIGATALDPNGKVSTANHNGNLSQVQANINGGLGVQWFFNRSIAFRVDARDLYTMAAHRNDIFLNLGMSFEFGGKNPSEPVLTKSAVSGPVNTNCLGQMPNIHFQVNSSNISGSSVGTVRHIGQCLKSMPHASARINGYTSSTGSKAYNKKLSQRRARALKIRLEKNYGIPASHIKTKGYGQSHPIASNKTLSGRSLNRRVETIIKK